MQHPQLPGFDGTPGYPIKNTDQPVVPTMSSLEIAWRTGKRHDNVMRDIRTTLEEAGIGALRFEGTHLDSQNKEQPCFHLPRRECDLVISGYSVNYRLAIIDRWHELESEQSLQTPKTFAGALRLAADFQDKVAEQETLKPSSSFQQARPEVAPIEG